MAHATPDLLAGYADGSLSDGMCLAVASHLTFCPRCRDKVSRLEEIGGALMAGTEPVDPPAGCLERALDRLDAPEPPDRDDFGPLPRPLRRRLATPLCSLRWRILLPGLSLCRLDGFADDVSMLRARPGLRIPAHAHTALEATVVLAGRMRDRGRVYGRGDLALADEHDDHHPEVVGPEPCLCLVVLRGPVRFTGRLGPVLNRLA
jgi:putative transcriptional regulator